MSTAATTAIESNMEKVANSSIIEELANAWAKAQGLTGVTYTGEFWGQNIVFKVVGHKWATELWVHYHKVMNGLPCEGEWVVWDFYPAETVLEYDPDTGKEYKMEYNAYSERYIETQQFPAVVI